jgi:YfiR/HmsC-like
MARSAIYAVALLVAIGGGADAAGIADATIQRADQLKAGYLLNFVKFVEWPASVSANLLTVCFVGGKGVRDALASGIDTKMAGERHLAVRSLSDSDPPVGCNVLYIDAAMMPEGAHEPNTAESPVLTVSDAKAFAHVGGMIELFSDANHLRFNINIASAQKAGLHISSSLLQLAAVVEQATPQ